MIDVLLLDAEEALFILLKMNQEWPQGNQYQ